MDTSPSIGASFRRCIAAISVAALLVVGLSVTGATPAGANAQGWNNGVLPGMPTQVNAFGTAVAGNIVFVIGGFDSANPGGTNLVQALDPTTGIWTAKATMPVSRSYFSAGLGPDGRIYVVGGYGYLTEVDAYTPSTNSWTTVAPLPYGVADAQVVSADGLLYVIGGGNSTGYLSTVEAYNPGTDSWTAKRSLPSFRVQFGAAEGHDGRIYVMGGIGNVTTHESVSGVVEIYNPVTDHWSRGATMPTPRRFPGVVVMSTGLIAAVGGETGGLGSGVASKVVTEYDPVSNTWAKMPNLLDANDGGGAADVANSLGEEQIVSVTGANTPAPTDLISVPGDQMADGYVLANQPTATSYAPTSTFQWNSTDAVNTIQRTGTGNYTVTFPFLATLATNGGTVDVTSFGTTPANCGVDNWNPVGGAIEAQISCFDDAGAALDSEFTASFTAPYIGLSPNLAYAWANDPLSPSYTPPSPYQYNTAGGPITIGNVGIGQYVVTVPGMGSVAGANGIIAVTPYGGSATSCAVVNWGPSGSAETIKVNCTTLSGSPVNTTYDVSFSYGINILGDNWLSGAYLLANQPTTGHYAPANQYNEVGGSNTVKRIAPGSYIASLPIQAPGGDPQVTSLASGNRCQVASFTSPNAGGTAKVSVLCFTTTGSPADSAYMLQWAHG